MKAPVGFTPSRHFKAILLTGALLVVGVVASVLSPSAKPRQEAPTNNDDALLLEGFRHVEVASVSDALEQTAGRTMYLSHRMRPIFPAKFAGFALTVLLKKEKNHDPEAL